MKRSEHIEWILDQLHERVDQKQMKNDVLSLNSRLRIDHYENDEVSECQMKHQK